MDFNPRNHSIINLNLKVKNNEIRNLNENN